MLPLGLAIIHSIFGIKFILSMMAALASPDELLPSVIATAVIIGIIYGLYFLATYIGSKNIIKEEEWKKIDNTKIEEVSGNDDMKYQYTLTAYDKNGKAKEIQFKTSRELREGAYLELDVMSIRGVIDWREV